MNAQSKSKRSAVERPEPLTFSQGVEGLVGPTVVATQKSSPKATARPKAVSKVQQKPAARRPPQKSPRPTALPVPSAPKPKAVDPEDAMSTLSLRFHKSYQDGLDRLYLEQRLKNNKLKKWHLLEEAIELLFKKYRFNPTSRR